VRGSKTVEFAQGARLAVRITRADVGKRVSVRTWAAPGDRPARFTDTVGVLVAWEDGVLSVTRRDGRVARLAESELVAAKVVPPGQAARPRRRGVPTAGVAELTAVAARAWPAPESERIGDWRLRAGAGWTRRANAAVAVGPEAAPPDLDRLAAWYAARGLPARLQLTTGGGGDGDDRLAAELEAIGWRADGHTVVRVAALAPLADRDPDERVRVGRELTDEWLRGYPRASQDPGTARRVLSGGPSVWFATVRARPLVVPRAVGRCVVDGRWAGFAAIEVAPAHRRTGLATAVMAELARAALGDGASAAYLQEETGNAPARALYHRLGFADHHHYHYRTA
jgi:N-acetylglutamate synthase